jgi:hypothetical protein
MLDVISQALLYTLLMGTSITLGFFLTSVFIVRINREANIEESEEEDELHLNSFLEELDNEPMSQLTEHELKNLETCTVVLSLDPLLKQTVRMYYRLEEDAFCYYSERESIYKYLDIVARHYVLQNHCKQIYVELSGSEEKVVEETAEITGPFVSKKTEKKKVYEKKLIRFIYKGNESDYQLKQKETLPSNNINILDFLKMNKKEDVDSDEYENISKDD